MRLATIALAATITACFSTTALADEGYKYTFSIPVTLTGIPSRSTGTITCLAYGAANEAGLPTRGMNNFTVPDSPAIVNYSGTIEVTVKPVFAIASYTCTLVINKGGAHGPVINGTGTGAQFKPAAGWTGTMSVVTNITP